MTPRSTPLEGPDGPSELTRAAVLCSACEQVLRPHLVEAAEWSDPADMSTRARYHGAKRIQGWRRVWSIQTLHDGSPREVTRQHLRAATRLLSDYELGVEGAQHGRNMERVDEGPRIGTDVPGARLDALRRHRLAMAALGEQAGFVVLAVAVGNWTIVELAKHLGIQRHRAHGRLAAGLERLREHYWPPREPVRSWRRCGWRGMRR